MFVICSKFFSFNDVGYPILLNVVISVVVLVGFAICRHIVFSRDNNVPTTDVPANNCGALYLLYPWYKLSVKLSQGNLLKY